MNRSNITAFIVNGADYFTAHTSNGSLRIGLVGSASFDIPAGHAWFERIAEAANEQNVEEYFDELVSAYA